MTDDPLDFLKDFKRRLDATEARPTPPRSQEEPRRPRGVSYDAQIRPQPELPDEPPVPPSCPIVSGLFFRFISTTASVFEIIYVQGGDVSGGTDVVLGTVSSPGTFDFPIPDSVASPGDFHPWMESFFGPSNPEYGTCGGMIYKIRLLAYEGTATDSGFFRYAFGSTVTGKVSAEIEDVFTTPTEDLPWGYTTPFSIWEVI